MQNQVNYDLVFVDYDFTDEEALHKYSNLPQEFVLLTKSYFMRKIDSMELDLLKTLYEPLNNSKIRQILENYHSENFTALQTENMSPKKFDAETSRFDAKVLIAEDNVINQKLIQRTLEDLGLNVSIASNGLEAFQKRKDGNFDLIFMDIQMPFLDGMEATREILEYEEDYNQPHVPILALTANALKGDRERFLKAGLDEYTTKPLIRTEIISLLNRFLSDHIIDVKDEPPVEDEKKEINTSYKADILFLKKSPFANKFFAKILDSLGYTYKIADTVQTLQTLLLNSSYNLVFIDDEIEDLNLASLDETIKSTNENRDLNSKLILMTENTKIEDFATSKYIDECIDISISKDSLKLVIDRFI